jgi:hypothetical protein
MSASVCLLSHFQTELTDLLLYPPPAERWCGSPVQPAEPEPTVLRRNSWAPFGSCLPILPRATASSAAKLCHRLHRPAAFYRGLLRLRPSHLPASSSGCSLSTGLRATASTCTGRCSFTPVASLICDESTLSFLIECCWVYLSCPSVHIDIHLHDLFCLSVQQCAQYWSSESQLAETDPTAYHTKGVFHVPDCWHRSYKKHWFLFLGKPCPGALWTLSFYCLANVFFLLINSQAFSGANLMLQAGRLLCEYKGGT